MAIELGRIYRAVRPTPSMPGEQFIRIRVTARGPSFPAWGWSKVRVETVLPDGTGIRERAIEATQLHDSPLTRDGQPRRTGYVRETSVLTTTTEG
ncbi:hypothetical protein [Streptacidiphilus cavernicola]|uniref:Uncharacterized protein n=1 Tax=Streptacidiphilus cavernicola TaxID=3342716 RepID=A0ABV6W456_9ACTN